jgi:hypothetical protein
MSRKKNRPGAKPAAQPGCSGPGREVRPDEKPAQTESDEAGGAMPLCLPIPLEHYEALQEDAKRRKPPHPDIAQEDPGGAEDT